jgi:type I restriction enzyme M protein
VWSDGILAEVWHRKNPNYFMSIHELPRADQTIEQVVDQPWTIQTLIDLEEARVKEGKFARSLRDLIEDMEDEVLANAGVDVFEEVFKLTFTKLYDEMNSHRLGQCVTVPQPEHGGTTEGGNPEPVRRSEAKKWPGVFLDDERIRYRRTICKSASARLRNGSSSIPTSM